MPLELRVWSMLRARVPRFQWDPRRVAHLVCDFEPYCDVEEVAARCADWMVSGQANRIADPEGTLRGFMERQKARNLAEPRRLADSPELTRYDRPLNRAA